MSRKISDTGERKRLARLSSSGRNSSKCRRLKQLRGVVLDHQLAHRVHLQRVVHGLAGHLQQPVAAVDRFGGGLHGRSTSAAQPDPPFAAVQDRQQPRNDRGTCPANRRGSASKGPRPSKTALPSPSQLLEPLRIDRRHGAEPRVVLGQRCRQPDETTDPLGAGCTEGETAARTRPGRGRIESRPPSCSASSSLRYACSNASTNSGSEPGCVLDTTLGTLLAVVVH